MKLALTSKKFEDIGDRLQNYRKMPVFPAGYFGIRIMFSGDFSGAVVLPA